MTNREIGEIFNAGKYDPFRDTKEFYDDSVDFIMGFAMNIGNGRIDEKTLDYMLEEFNADFESIIGYADMDFIPMTQGVINLGYDCGVFYKRFSANEWQKICEEETPRGYDHERRQRFLKAARRLRKA